MVDQAVYEFRERLKYDGCMTNENEETLKKSLADICGKEEKVEVKADREETSFGLPIYYEVRLSMDSILSNKLVSTKDQKPYTVKGKVTSCLRKEVREEKEEEKKVEKGEEKGEE